MQLIKNYIAGELKEPAKKKYLDNVEPATGQVYSQIPNSTAEDLELAVEAAEKVQPSWAGLSLEKRAEILMKVADAIDDHSNELAKAEAIDNGKPFSLAKAVDIYRASANIRFFAQAITQFSSESHAMGDEAINYTLRDPVGVVGCISPWNLPLYLFTWKIAPALAAGNAVIAKPSEVTPMTAFLLSKICIEAGLPAGVLNILHGDGPSIGDPLTTHPKIKAISFTGGTSTGAHISKVTAGMFKKLSLELGGKNPTLVFADCDFEDTVSNVVRAAFSNQGQICLCGSRIYIERPIYEKFKQAFIQKVQALKVGDPLQEDTQHGALVSKPHMEKVLSYIELAQEEGGNILTGGKQVTLEGRCEKGYFVEPTVIEGLDNDCRTNQEEIFGPVCTIMPFDTDEEAVTLANGTQYGLASSIWTNDLKRAHRVAKQIEAGIVWVNCWLLRDLRTPFGGVKNSGVGREGGLEALRFFTETKNVCIKYS
ncbi:aldehyde dehydrogenase [Kangiella sediminilitoris]|uniref:2-hydroxymuconic semialdehyde dehydrogenase n=1 Tax=Kangiella sediminilitoris TaxID=1144748 RepID=A0A1B3BD97_9GAMM|nr:aldehyde dehydrogenase [Kangiella sediminilitoris]AOE50738.1 2-hydroxymuconic semialdehyde dehydrogenase [Kangiella sediminilitoris]